MLALRSQCLYENQPNLLAARAEIIETATEIIETATEIIETATYSDSHAHNQEITHQEYKQKPSQGDVLQERLKAILPSPFASPFARRVYGVQEYMKGENWEFNIMRGESASAYQPATVYITPNSVRVVNRLLGNGTQGEVYKVTRIFNNPSKEDEEEALKFSKTKNPHLDRLRQIPSEECTTLNFSLQSYLVPSETGNKHCDVLPLGVSDFKRFNFLAIEKPIQCMLNLMKDVAQGADTLHKQNLLHRDIKPENIIVLEGGKKGQLGDLDIMMQMKEEEHQTTCTPPYAHPSIWGNDLMKQAKRLGHQTKEDDVFALGRTIQYGLISKIFYHYTKTKTHHSNIQPIIKKDQTEAQVDQLVRTAHRSNKILIVFKTLEIKDQMKIIPKDILIYPSINDLERTNESGLEILKEELEPNEYQALKTAIDLANNLQRDIPNERHSMQRIVELIQAFQNSLKTPISGSPQIEKSLEDVDTAILAGHSIQALSQRPLYRLATYPRLTDQTGKKKKGPVSLMHSSNRFSARIAPVDTNVHTQSEKENKKRKRT